MILKRKRIPMSFRNILFRRPPTPRAMKIEPHSGKSIPKARIAAGSAAAEAATRSDPRTNLCVSPSLTQPLSALLPDSLMAYEIAHSGIPGPNIKSGANPAWRSGRRPPNRPQRAPGLPSRFQFPSPPHPGAGQGLCTDWPSRRA